MLTRATTGALFVIVLLTSIYYGSYSSLLLFSIVVVLGIDELYNTVKKNKTIAPIKFWGILIGLISFIVICLIAQGVLKSKYIFITIPFIFFTFIIELYRNKTNPFVNVSYTLLASLYVVLPFAMLYHLGFYEFSSFQSNFSYQIIIGFFIMLWANDTGAYLTGKYLGKHKLFERVSPKKTWEGSIGGGALAIISGYIISLFYENLVTFDWIAIAIIIVIFGGIGDLIESMHKRSVGIKDSGSILPGHGGILDRFDGLLISVPFVYFYLQLIN